jgi:hypothetical protein
MTKNKVDVDQAIHAMSSEDQHELIFTIYATLYPNDNLDYEWSPDELDKLAGILKDAGLVDDET